MQLWIVVTLEGTGNYKDEKHATYIREKDVIADIGEIVAGNRHVMDDEIELVSIHRIETNYGKIEKLNVVLENMKLVLKPA